MAHKPGFPLYLFLPFMAAKKGCHCNPLRGIINSKQKKLYLIYINIIFDIMENIEKAILLKGELDEMRPLKKENLQRIMQKFRLDWNYHSSKIEGNKLTYGETKALILHNITAQAKPLRDHIEMTGHNEAINLIIDVVDGERPLNQTFICEIHKLLLKEPYEVDAITPDGKPTKKLVNVGEYKKTQNHVKTKTGEIFRFAEPEETPAKMTDLLDWYREIIKTEKTNPILIASKFHYELIRIHPFDDGNGRTARLLMNFILMKFGYPPVVIKTDDKENYFKVLQLADAGQIEPFVNYIARNLIHSLEIMIAGGKGKNIEEDDDIDKEIKLLEDRLNNISDKYKDLKSKEVLKEVYEKNLYDFIKGFIHSNFKFKNLYQNVSFSINTGSLGHTYSIDNWENLNESFTDTTVQIQIDVNFEKLKNLNYEEPNYTSHCRIIFEPSKFRIRLHPSDQELKFYYKEDIDKDQLTKLLKNMSAHHKKDIQFKISEATTEK
ncbi:Fic family protein [Lacinutrix salivirga]